MFLICKGFPSLVFNFLFFSEFDRICDYFLTLLNYFRYKRAFYVWNLPPGVNICWLSTFRQIQTCKLAHVDFVRPWSKVHRWVWWKQMQAGQKGHKPPLSAAGRTQLANVCAAVYAHSSLKVVFPISSQPQKTRKTHTSSGNRCQRAPCSENSSLRVLPWVTVTFCNCFYLQWSTWISEKKQRKHHRENALILFYCHQVWCLSKFIGEIWRYLCRSFSHNCPYVEIQANLYRTHMK